MMAAAAGRHSLSHPRELDCFRIPLGDSCCSFDASFLGCSAAAVGCDASNPCYHGHKDRGHGLYHSGRRSHVCSRGPSCRDHGRGSYHGTGRDGRGHGHGRLHDGVPCIHPALGREGGR